MIRGRPYLGRKSVLLYVYEREYGTVPMGFKVVRNDHEPGCDRDCVHTRCVNPAHLLVVPNGGNSQRMQMCSKGHDLTDPANVYEANGRRWCYPCRRDNRADWERRNPNYEKHWRARRKNVRSPDP